MKLDELKAPHAYPDNLLAYYKHIRDNDVYVVYAVVPPQAARNPEFYQRQNIPVPTLRVVREDDDGVVISGMKMLATGAVFANEIWIGNVIPLAPDQKQEAITCAIPCNAPGLKLWSRQPVEHKTESEFDSPLSYRYDESDSMLLCDEVKVPWERVFVHGDALLSRDIYIKTPSHCFGNHQSNVRYWSKMRSARRPRQQDRARDRRRSGPGGARGARPHLGAGGDDRRHGERADQRLRDLAGRPGGLCLLQPAHDVRRAGMVHPELQQVHR